MNQTADLVANLENLLVTEFHTCQSLHNLTKEEREVLIRNDVTGLARLVERKEAVLDELGHLDDQRRMVVQEVAGFLGLRSPAPTIAEIAGALADEPGERLNRLREGVVALTGEIRRLTGGNAALAVTALERTDALQSFLLDMYRPAVAYQPPGVPRSNNAELAWGVDQRT